MAGWMHFIAKAVKEKCISLLDLGFLIWDWICWRQGKKILKLGCSFFSTTTTKKTMWFFCMWVYSVCLFLLKLTFCTFRNRSQARDRRKNPNRWKRSRSIVFLLTDKFLAQLQGFRFFDSKGLFLPRAINKKVAKIWKDYVVCSTYVDTWYKYKWWLWHWLFLLAST